MTEQDKLAFIEFMEVGKGDNSWTDLAENFGFISGESARKYWSRHKRQSNVKSVKNNLKTVTESIGLDVNSWDIKEVWSKHKEINHPIEKGGKMSLFETTAKLYPKAEEHSFKDAFKDFVDNYKGIKEAIGETLFNLPKPVTPNILILSLSDLHIDKKTYFEETREFGDMDIASSRAVNACFDLVERATSAHDISKIVIIGGNDFFHANTAANTTQKGTPLDVDGRWHQSFKKGLALATTIIDFCAEYCPVEYITVLGNHSPEREWYLSVALEAFYRNVDNVYVETLNNTKKYFSFGKTAFMLTHEVGNKAKDLPLIFAVEQPELFAKSKYKFVLTGHLHKRFEAHFIGTNENYGVVFKILPSLCSTDKWHHDNNFIGNQKSCIAMVINEEYGDIAELIYNE